SRYRKRGVENLASRFAKKQTAWRRVLVETLPPILSACPAKDSRYAALRAAEPRVLRVQKRDGGSRGLEGHWGRSCRLRTRARRPPGASSISSPQTSGTGTRERHMHGDLGFTLA